MILWLNGGLYPQGFFVSMKVISSAKTASQT
jgi:hypothetical protein